MINKINVGVIAMESNNIVIDIRRMCEEFIRLNPKHMYDDSFVYDVNLH